MYNKTKRSLKLVTAILGLVTAGIGYVEGILVMIVAMAAFELLASAGALLLIIAIAYFGLAIAFTILGVKGCKKPVAVEGGFRSTKGADIGIIIVAIIQIIFCIINWGGINIAILIASLGVLGVGIAVLCVKDIDPSSPAPAVLNDQENSAVSSDEFMDFNSPASSYTATTSSSASTGNSVEAKINELKRLKELGVISEQQYNAGVEKAINDLTK